VHRTEARRFSQFGAADSYSHQVILVIHTFLQEGCCAVQRVVNLWYPPAFTELAVNGWRDSNESKKVMLCASSDPARCVFQAG
jgi:hypothetical protein